MKQSKKPLLAVGKVRAGLVITLALAAGISTIGQAAPSTVGRSTVQSVDAQTSDFSAYAFVSGNGDGTATVGTFAVLGDGTYIDAFDPANVGFEVSNDVKSGMSAKGSFSGTGQAVMPGTHFDPDTGVSTPVTVSIDITVTGAGDISAYSNQGVFVQTDPNTGEPQVVKQHFRGNQAFGMTSGAFTITVDGVDVVGSTGGFGSVADFDIHTVTRLR